MGNSTATNGPGQKARAYLVVPRAVCVRAVPEFVIRDDNPVDALVLSELPGRELCLELISESSYALETNAPIPEQTGALPIVATGEE